MRIDTLAKKTNGLFPLMPVSEEADKLVLDYLRRRELSKTVKPQPEHSLHNSQNWRDINAIFDFASDVAKLDTKRLYYLW